MNDKRTPVAWIVAGLMLMVVVIVGSYAGAYFALCIEEIRHASFDGVMRVYAYSWLARLFDPAAAVHSMFQGEMVICGHREIVTF